jgi:coatomer protein complex subunit gamma
MTSFGGSVPQTYNAVSNSNIVQYHALGLLYVIRQKDRMAVSKLVELRRKEWHEWFGSPLSICPMSSVHYACKVMEEDPR